MFTQPLGTVTAIADFALHDVAATPFTQAPLPAVIATFVATSDINRFSHVVMAASPVSAPFSPWRAKSARLRLFGAELRIRKTKSFVLGNALGLPPPAPLPSDKAWAKPDPRIPRAVARRATGVEREAQEVASAELRRMVRRALNDWHGKLMPMSRSCVESEVADLRDDDCSIAQIEAACRVRTAVGEPAEVALRLASTATLQHSGERARRER